MDTDYRLADWTVRPDLCRLEQGERTVHLKPKSMEVLSCLARANGAVVSRNQLFDAVWPGGAVSDDALTQCVVEIRRAFGDSARDPTIIETIPKRGFRLLPDVVPVHPRTADGPSVNASAAAAGGRLATDPSGGGYARRRVRYGSDRRAPVWVATAAAVVGLFAIAAAITMREDRPAPDATARTLAVLPFVDMSPDGEQSYFADGLSEELINQLTRLRGLRVTGRTSAFRFRDRERDIREVGQALGVDHVLEGSVRKSDSRVRVTAQLMDVTTGFHLWSENYDRPLADIFSVQDEIAKSVATALSIRLQVGDLGTMVGGTANVDAFDNLVRGKWLMYEFTADSVLRAIRHFSRATEIDPGYAEAWAGLANAYRNANLVLGNEDVNDWYRKAGHAISLALELAPESPSVLRAAAFLHADTANWIEAETLLMRSDRAVNGSDVRLSGAYIDMLSKVGRAKDGLRWAERARGLNPLDPGASMYLGHLYLIDGRFDDALRELDRGYALGGPVPLIAVEGLVAALSAGDPATLHTWLQRAIAHQQPGANGVNERMAGLLDDPEAAVRWLRRGFDEQSVPDFYVAVWASYFGVPELAMRAMQRTPDPWIFWIPLTAEMRRLPGFKALAADLRLPEYWRVHGWAEFCRPTGPEDFECGSRGL